MTNNNGGLIRVSKNFRELIEKLKEIEEKRGVNPCSYPIITEILFHRIQNAGGLRE